MRTEALACRIGAIPRNERPRYEQLKAKIASAIDSSKTIGRDSGMIFHFSGDETILRTLGDWMAFEQSCCPFFRFELSSAPNHGPVSLRISGPPGTTELLKPLIEKSD